MAKIIMRPERKGKTDRKSVRVKGYIRSKPKPIDKNCD